MMKIYLIKKKAEEFLLAKQAMNSSVYSLYAYKSIMKDFIAYIEECKIKTTLSLNQHLLDEYSVRLIKKNISGKTILNRAKVINQFMKFCGKNLKMKKVKFDESRKPALSVQEIKKLIQSTKYDNPISVLCYFLLATGARSRTVRNIKVSDIDFETGFINFITTKTRKIVKAPICKNLEKILHKYIAQFNLKNSNYLFFNEAGNPFSKSAIYRRVNTYLKSIGIENQGVHIFRHTFAKACVLNGCDSITLAELMGHSNIKQSQEYVLFYSKEIQIKGSKVNPVQNLSYLKYTC